MLKLIETADKSYSFRDEVLNETYHSVHGAEAESLHVFIKSGLDYFASSSKERDIHILEVGLGTGLNAILSLEWLNEHPDKRIVYQAIEPFPIQQELVIQLLEVTENPERAASLEQIHFSDWDEPTTLNAQFTFLKHKVALGDYQTSDSFSIVYFDAFGPQVQAEMWTEEMIRKSTESLLEGGIWVSYCAKGQVRRNLINCGMKVERLAGPPPKREMLRAKR